MSRRCARRWPPYERGQASVELAVVLPVVAVLVLLVAQVVLLARDRVLVVHAAREAARAVVVDPTEAAAQRALEHLGAPTSSAEVTLHGDRRPGSLVRVRVELRARTVPLLGRLAPLRLSEELTVRVEGG